MKLDDFILFHKENHAGKMPIWVKPIDWSSGLVLGELRAQGLSCRCGTDIWDVHLFHWDKSRSIETEVWKVLTIITGNTLARQTYPN